MGGNCECFAVYYNGDGEVNFLEYESLNNCIAVILSSSVLICSVIHPEFLMV